MKASIKIDNPCPMSWNNMKNVGDNKFRLCNGCSKHVVDFTQSSNEEIISAISKNPTICGKFNEDQLVYNPVKSNSFRYRINFFLLFLIGLLGFRVSPLNAQITRYNRANNGHYRLIQGSRYNEKADRIRKINKNKSFKGIVRHRLYRKEKRTLFRKRHFIGCPSNLWD